MQITNANEVIKANIFLFNGCQSFEGAAIRPKKTWLGCRWESDSKNFFCSVYDVLNHWQTASVAKIVHVVASKNYKLIYILNA